MNIKLMVGFLLMGSGIWGAQIDQQPSQESQLTPNKRNLLVGLKMLSMHNIVLNEYQNDALRTTKDQATADSKQVVDLLNKNKKRDKNNILLMNNEAMYCLGEGKWLEFNVSNYVTLSNEIIIFNIFPSLDNQSAAGQEIAGSCSKIKSMSGRGVKILINTDARTDVEKALESFFDKTSWARVPASKIVPTKKSAYSFKAQVILGGSIAALVALLCYLRWGR